MGVPIAAAVNKIGIEKLSLQGLYPPHVQGVNDGGREGCITGGRNNRMDATDPRNCR
jgi:hypothetical protein